MPVRAFAGTGGAGGLEMSDGAGVDSATPVAGNESGCGANDPFRTRPVGFAGNVGIGFAAGAFTPGAVASAERDATDRSPPDDSIEPVAGSDTALAGRSMVFEGAAAA